MGATMAWEMKREDEGDSGLAERQNDLGPRGWCEGPMAAGQYLVKSESGKSLSHVRLSL